MALLGQAQATPGTPRTGPSHSARPAVRAPIAPDFATDSLTFAYTWVFITWAPPVASPSNKTQVVLNRVLIRFQWGFNWAIKTPLKPH